MIAQRHSVIRGGLLLDAPAHGAEPVDLLIAGDTIRKLGAPGLAAPEGAEVIDAAGMLLIPGLVNAHTHSHGNLSKGIGDRWTLELLLNAAPRVSGGRTLDDIRLSALLGAAEMVLRGCTACYDLFSQVPLPTEAGVGAVADAYAEVGMRAVIAPMLADRTIYDALPGLIESLPRDRRADAESIKAAPGDASLAAMRRVLEAWNHDREYIVPAVAPTIPLLCSPGFLEGCRDLAREHGVGLHTHLAESRVWAMAGVTSHGMSLTAWLDRMGMLGPDLVAAHAVWVDDDDIRRLAERGASVSHNPTSNLRLGSGIARVRRMLELGVNVGLGTDATHCGDHLNMIECMRAASYVSRVRGRDYPDWIGTDEAFRMATEGSARALGLEGRIGRLAPGYKADIVFLELADIAFQPLNDPMNQLVHSADSSCVSRVMIGGRTVVRDGRLVSLDAERLRADVECARARLWEAQADARARAARLEDLVGAYARRLARSV